ncbi:MAG: LysM peptidoglycan-binding domain-containing protein [Ignavibacteria bacterium]|nr:LysM peptidoglycan-binding domain-containing protein [Ignavibacteria bacterium]
MKFRRTFFALLAGLLVLPAGVSIAQEEMTKEQWQQDMQTLTTQRTELQTKVKSLTDEVSAMQSKSTQLDADYRKCMDELYALVGSNAELAAAYRKQIEDAENKANDLIRLSDADLVARSSEVDDLDNSVKQLWENKLSLIPEFWDRLTALNDKVKSLRTTLAGAQKIYTVGTWSRDRDCLWNISKKTTIYDNAWLWPKIWQNNRDQIKDPDIIHPGQKLKVPTKAELTDEEKTAARSYYSRKAGQ